jgi:hypothetical protein
VCALCLEVVGNEPLPVLLVERVQYTLRTSTAIDNGPVPGDESRVVGWRPVFATRRISPVEKFVQYT